VNRQQLRGCGNRPLVLAPKCVATLFRPPTKFGGTSNFLMTNIERCCLDYGVHAF
jgi:hypothetical protein